MPKGVILELGDFRAVSGGPKAGIGEKGGLKIEWDSSIKVEVFNPYHVDLISRVEPDQGPSDPAVPSPATSGRSA